MSAWTTGPRGEELTLEPTRVDAIKIVDERQATLLSAALIRARADRLPSRWSRVLGWLFVVVAGIAGVAVGVDAADHTRSWTVTSGRTEAATPPYWAAVPACLGECPAVEVACDPQLDLGCEETAEVSDVERFVLGAVRWTDSGGDVHRDVIPVPLGSPAGAERPLWVSGRVVSAVDPMPGVWPAWALVSIFAAAGVAGGRLAGVMVGWPIGWMVGFPYRRKANRVGAPVVEVPWWSQRPTVPSDPAALTAVDRMLLAHYTAPAPRKSPLMRLLTTPLFGPRRSTALGVEEQWRRCQAFEDGAATLPPSEERVRGVVSRAAGDVTAGDGVDGLVRPEISERPSAFPAGVPIVSPIASRRS